MKNAKKVIIIGAGAAGLVAAYLCAVNGAKVTLLEKNTVVGKKLSMTGNGRANLTNYEMNDACFNPAARKLAHSLLSRFGTEQVVTFFREIGVLTRSEEGYVYPVSGEAATVTHALEQAVHRAGVELVTSVQVKRIEIIKPKGRDRSCGTDVDRLEGVTGACRTECETNQCVTGACRTECETNQCVTDADRKRDRAEKGADSRFRVIASRFGGGFPERVPASQTGNSCKMKKDGSSFNKNEAEKNQLEFTGDCVILASGGLAGPDSCMSTGDGYYMAELLGIPVTPRFPALTGLKSPDASLSVKNGIRTFACVSLFIGEKEVTKETGEVQITNGILSGIPVMQLSREVYPCLKEQQAVSIVLDFFPDFSDFEFANLVQERIRKFCFEHGDQSSSYAHMSENEDAGESIRSVDAAHDGGGCHEPDALAGINLSDFLLGFSSTEINTWMMTHFHLAPDTDISIVGKNTLKKLLYGYKNVPFRISGVCDYKRAQVTAGGIRTDALTKHMESVQQPGVYVIGEMVDADGRCGGYNLQWAFMTAMAAAEHITVPLSGR